MNEDWMAAWQPVIEAVGSDLGQDDLQGPTDSVEPGTLRRYLEPLEFDCALHSDPDVARAHGHPDVIAPYTAALSYTMSPMWRPGEPTLFPSAEKDAQPERSAVKPVYPDFFPPFIGYFATDMEMDFIRPVHLGERVIRRGQKLLACNPKETRVGRGAFLTIESEIATDAGEVVARMRTSVFLYNPLQEAAR